MIKNNIKFSLFIFAADTYDKENSFQILKAYIGGGSKSKKHENENNISISYETNKNEEIKKNTLLEKKEQILFCQKKSFMESIFILNKIDKFKDKKEEGKKCFRNFIKNNFRINLNDDNQPCIIGSKLNDEIIKLELFKDYVKFIIFNSDKKCKINNFYNNISKIMNQDFKANIKIKNEESDEDTEKEEEEEEKEEVPSFMKKEEYQN